MSKLTLVVLLGLSALLLWRWKGHHAIPCVEVAARSHTTPFTDGCSSSFGFCTQGDLSGDPVLTGTTRYVGAGLALAAGLWGQVPATQASYTGDVVFTLSGGTLTLRDLGVTDLQAGGRPFAEIANVTGGTGRFAGATGTIFVRGATTDGGASYDSTYGGQICLVE